MKLRNKKTGEIKDLLWVINNLENDKDTFTLAELNEEWEDYEEPEEYYYIRSDGEIGFSAIHDETTIRMKIIGNYFKTYEEVEKVVEKFKAWKRLKDKGFKITLVTSEKYGYLKANWQVLNGDISDVRLLFGGKE